MLDVGASGGEFPSDDGDGGRGNATVATQITCANIITSGLVGILYYKEGGPTSCKVVWFVAALWTLVAMLLLGREKAS